MQTCLIACCLQHASLEVSPLERRVPLSIQDISHTFEGLDLNQGLLKAVLKLSQVSLLLVFVVLRFGEALRSLVSDSSFLTTNFSFSSRID